jgi:malonate transporter and related proteins
MQSILAVTVPFFALVLTGYVAARQGWLPDAAIPGLNGFVLFFALPCLLFRFGAGTPVLELLSPALLLAYLAAQLLMVLLAIAFTLSRHVDLKNAAFGALVAAFPNTGFMGAPLLTALLGSQAVGPVVTTILVDLFVTSSLCIAIAQAHGAAEHGARTAALRALKGALANPLPWAIAAGALASATGAKLPGALDTVVKMLADAASPVALFAIGAVLWYARRHAGDELPASAPRYAPTPLSRYLPVALMKLLLHPLLVLLIMLGARALGAPISGGQTVIVVLAAALPSASSVALLSDRYGADTARIARIIMASTALAFVTFSLLAWSFGVRPVG